jgi:predicted XRE-type DNA-binding protein
MSEWGERIKAVIDQRPDLSQAGLARACKVSGPTVSDWVNGGITMLAGDNLVQASRYLGRSAEWIMTGREASQSGRFDPDMLAESIAVLRRVAANHGWSYDPQENPEETIWAYTLRSGMPANPSTADVIDFGQKLADRLRKVTGGGDGSGDGGPTSGVDRKRAKSRKA